MTPGAAPTAPLTIETYAQNWATRSDKLRQLSTKFQEAGSFLEDQTFDPSSTSDDIETWEKNAKAYYSKLTSDRNQLDKLLTEAWQLRKDLEDLDALDVKIAKEYGLSVEDLAGFISPELKDESRWAQQEAVEGSLWLANAVVGYNERATAQANSYLETWKTIRKEVKVVPNLWGTNTEGTRQLDELDTILLDLEKAATGEGSPMSWITVNSLASEKATIDLVNRIKTTQGNNYGDPVQLALDRLNVWRLKSGNNPAKDWSLVWAKQVDSYIGNQLTMEAALKEAKEHSAWMRWIKNNGGFLPGDGDEGSDPNPFIPI